MKNLTTKYEKRSVIEYGRDGMSVVVGLHDMQNVVGPVFKSRPLVRGQEVVCHLYLFFDDQKNGVCFERNLDHIEQYSVEHIAESLRRSKMDTLEAYMEMLDETVKKGMCLGEDTIQFVRQFDEKRGDVYEKARMDYYAQQIAKRIKRVESRREADLKRMLAAQKDEDSKRARRSKWEKRMMEEGVSDSRLNELTYVNGRVMKLKEFLVQSVAGGWKPVERKCGGRIMYRLEKADKTYKIPRYGYEYAKAIYEKLNGEGVA